MYIVTFTCQEYKSSGWFEISKFQIWKQQKYNFWVHMSIVWIYVMSHVCPASAQPSLVAKTFNIGHCTLTVQPIVFIPALFIGVIDFYHFMLLSLTLTCPGVTRSAQIKTYWLHFLKHFSFDEDEIWCGDEAIQAELYETTFVWDLVKSRKQILFYTLCQKSLTLACIRMFIN